VPFVAGMVTCVLVEIKVWLHSWSVSLSLLDDNYCAKNLAIFMYSKNKFRCLLICVMYLASTGLFAASVNFIKIETVIVKPRQPVEISPYSINLESYSGPIKKRVIQYSSNIKSEFIYLTKVAVDNKFYYRLVTGNFKNRKQADLELSRIKKYYPGAWINIRSKQEQQQLGRLLTPVKKQQPVQKKVVPKIALETKPLVKKQQPVPKIVVSNIVLKNKPSADLNPADELLDQAKQEFLDGNYTRVLAIANKVIEIGTTEQAQMAMELSGIARERQNKFAQAVAIYTDFLYLYPDSEMTTKIKNRLDGLKTMALEPKSRIDPDNRRSADSGWNVNGALSQYYRNDVIESENANDTEIVSSVLVTDIDLIATHKTDTSSLVLHFDGGMFRNIEDEETESRIGHALVSYTNSESGYQVTGGRQRGTARGVYSRFDGFVFKSLSPGGFSYSVYTGFPVQTSYDDVQSDRQFIGTNVHFSPFSRVEMDVYLLHQEVSDLTDRQALGTEFEYRRGRGYLLGIIDYDLFYGDLNNFTTIGSIPFSEKLDFNLSYSFRNAPLLTTSNAMVGQAVTSIEELKALFTDEEIYQLAEDRTSKGQNVNLSSNYQIDNRRQLYLSFSYDSIEETIASGGVAATPATDYLYFAADYSIRGFFSGDDYTSFGFRLSDTTSTNVISLRARTSISGSGNLRYDPRIRLDYRQNNDSDAVQWILNPSIKLTYRSSKKLSFEAILGLEYSDSEIPELGDHVGYSLFLGYVYQF